MALPVWGNLEKSQVDSETIEEAIARLIQAHEDDPNAHIEAGESLQSHKASAIIDHLIASIISDKIKRGEIVLPKLSLTQYHLLTVFESLDGWTGVGAGVTSAILGLTMQTGAVINTVKKISAEPMGDSSALDFSKNPFFQSSVKISSDSDALTYFMVGSCELDGTDNSFGFKIIEDIVYAIHIKGDGMAQVEYTTQLGEISPNIWNVYRAEFDTTAGEIRFYVNGDLLATHNSNLPVDSSAVIMSYYIKNTVAANKILYAKDLLWSRDR